MNNIVSTQNKSENIDLLHVQRCLYTMAKKVFVYRTLLALLVAILGPIITKSNNIVATYVGLGSILYLILDNLLLERIEVTNKTNAAKMQELFDTSVLDLEWNGAVSGSRPDTEIMEPFLSRKQDKDISALQDWYAHDVEQVDINLGRFLCQRSNAWWDACLRNRYIVFLYIVLGIMVGSIFVLGSLMHLTTDKFILGVMVPIIPLAEIIIRQLKYHHESAQTIKDLQQKLDSTIEKIFKHEIVDNPKQLARTYQDEIFRHRKQCPMVFDWLYWVFRDRQENQMVFTISRKVKDYLNNDLSKK